MPSDFEPCGLSQIISLKYGALPLVRETGGLKDTVFSYNDQTRQGNGFSFTNSNADDLWYTLCRAMSVYYDRRAEWDAIVAAAMKCDYSWKKSADKYTDLYNTLTQSN